MAIPFLGSDYSKLADSFSGVWWIALLILTLPFLALTELKKCKLPSVRPWLYFDFCVRKGLDADVRV